MGRLWFGRVSGSQICVWPVAGLSPVVSAFFEHQLTVLPEWIDDNGHMNVAYYVLAFDQATDSVYEQVGLSWAYLEAQNHTLFTLSMNVDYLQEVFEGDRLRITTQLLECDDKRLHYFHHMYHAGKGFLSATNECLSMHISMETRRSAPFSSETKARLHQVILAHGSLPWPDGVGRKIGLRKST